MKKIFAAFITLFLLCGCVPTAESGSAETKAGIVVDRAMSGGLPYIGVEFEDGSRNCFYDLKQNAIPDDIAIGDRVELTYGLDERTNSWFVIGLRELES